MAPLPVALQPVRLTALLRRRWDAGERRFLLAWLLASAVIVPSALVTRLFELTGVGVTLGGVDFHLTLYLPLILCVPIALWFGYPWAAIPAYFSTFAVALMGGMPVGWIVLFAFANPLGLAVFLLICQSLPMRIDLRTVGSFTLFVVAVFAMSIIGSAGAFIWAETNAVGQRDFFPVWQGWWLGGFLQSVLLSAPLLMLLTPAVMRWKQACELPLGARSGLRGDRLLSAAILVTAAVAAFVVIVRWFSLGALETALGGELSDPVRNAVAGLALPHWVMLAMAAIALFFGYRVGVLWSSSIRRLAGRLETANQELERKNEQLQATSLIDQLTGAANRAHYYELLEAEIVRCRRYGGRFGCGMLDIDAFKSINDRYGHVVGDRLLSEIARIARAQLRAGDVIARYGGDEFAFLFPATDLRGSSEVAERVRQAIAGHDFGPIGIGEPLTVSLGVAAFEPQIDDCTPEACLTQADAEMYEAKRAGRDRVTPPPSG